MDCAMPRRPPEAIQASLEASGWKTAEPMPTRATATRTITNSLALDKRIMPASVKHIPAASEKGFGLLSVYIPTKGCSREAVNWKQKVTNPNWLKLRFKDFFSSG